MYSIYIWRSLVCRRLMGILQYPTVQRFSSLFKWLSKVLRIHIPIMFSVFTMCQASSFNQAIWMCVCVTRERVWVVTYFPVRPVRPPLSHIIVLHWDHGYHVWHTHFCVCHRSANQSIVLFFPISTHWLSQFPGIRSNDKHIPCLLLSVLSNFPVLQKKQDGSFNGCVSCLSSYKPAIKQ